MSDNQELFSAIREFEIDLIKFEDDNNLKEFNAFEVLKIQWKELSHSNVLSWLLSPEESHGLGDAFLKEVLEDYKKENQEFQADCSPNLDYASFYTLRENDNIDIKVISDKEKIVIAIENKIWHAESEDQLLKYTQIIERKYNDYTKGFIYLTPNVIEASNPKWMSYGYKSILRILNQFLEKDTIKLNEVRIFIQHYAQNLRRNIVEDLEMKKQIELLYRKHKTAIDLINKNLPNRNEIISLMFREYLTKRENVIIDKFDSNIFRFTTKIIDNIIPKDSNYWEYRLFLFEFTIQKDFISINSVITPSDKDSKLNLLSYVSNIEDKSIINKKENCLKSKKFHHINSYPLMGCKIEELFDDENFKFELFKKLDKYFDEYIPKLEEALSKFV